MMPRNTILGTLAALLVISACKENDPTPPPPIGPPAQLVPIAGASQNAPANTDLPGTIQLSVRDANGNVLGAGHVVTFSVVAGGGSITSSSATSDNNGTVTGPVWRLGRSAVPQVLRATLNDVVQDVGAFVATQYQIEVRFWGEPMSPANQLLFANAAARISAIITGDIADADGRGSNINLLTDCDVTGQPILNEIIDDILIFASIQPIDGAGNILARAGPCIRRDAAPVHIAIGTMEFDIADLGRLAGNGNLQEVVIHEMLHVLGVGTLWGSCDGCRGLLTGTGTSDPRFTGPQARLACVAAGAPTICSSTVPVEGTGGAGTVNSHWRETTFSNELMTGFLDAGSNPFSAITVGSLTDIGFTVNAAAADPYTVPLGFMRTNPMIAAHPDGWERIKPMRAILHANGRVERLRQK